MSVNSFVCENRSFKVEFEEKSFVAKQQCSNDVFNPSPML